MAQPIWIKAVFVALTALGSSAVIAAQSDARPANGAPDATQNRGALGGASGVRMTPDGPKSGSNEPVWRRDMSEGKGEGMLDNVPRDAGNTAGGNRDMGQQLQEQQNSSGQRQAGSQARGDAKENADWAKKEQQPERPDRAGAATSKEGTSTR